MCRWRRRDTTCCWERSWKRLCCWVRSLCAVKTWWSRPNPQVPIWQAAPFWMEPMRDKGSWLPRWSLFPSTLSVYSHWSTNLMLSGQIKPQVWKIYGYMVAKSKHHIEYFLAKFNYSVDRFDIIWLNVSIRLKDLRLDS